MEPTPQNIILLINLLTQSLSPHPSIRQPAEKQLQAAEKDDGFLILLIAVIRGEGEGGGGSGGGGMDVRQAAGVLFKNGVKRRWRDVSFLFLLYFTHFPTVVFFPFLYFSAFPFSLSLFLSLWSLSLQAITYDS